VARTPITRVRAVDPDLGANGRVVYGLAAQTRALYGHLFTVDNRTGEISARAAIDREAHAAFQLIVTAEDAGPDSHPVDATVVVTVADVNDNRPTIVVNTLAAVGADRAAVPENAAPGTGHLRDRAAQGPGRPGKGPLQGIAPPCPRTPLRAPGNSTRPHVCTNGSPSSIR